MASVQLRDIHKSFGATNIIKGIDLDIAHGEFVVFVGPSGCGKSTLLRLIAGLEEITSGTLSIGDRVVNIAERVIFMNSGEMRELNAGPDAPVEKLGS